MTAAAIRCANDLKMYQSLLENADVKRVCGRIQRMEEKRDNPRVRRHLLATSVRLSRSMSAPLHHMADQCTERLGIDSPLELYAYASPQFNAACFKPEEGRSEEHTSELQSRTNLVCRLLLEKKKKKK